MNPADALLPLLVARDLDAPLAWRDGQPISARRFLHDVARQARRLPEAGPAVNLCLGRYAFAVGLGAALLRGHASLLPPDARPDTLTRVCAAHAHPYLLSDQPEAPAADWPVVRLPGGPDGAIEEGEAVDEADEAQAGDDAVPPAIAAGRHAVSLLTSGSTGVPQPHAKRWDTLVGDVAAAVPRLCEQLGLDSLAGLNLVGTVPVQHSYGLESTVLLALLGGAAFDDGRPYFPADIVQALQRLPRPRGLVTTPFHLKTLLQSGLPLPPVDLILSATAPLSPQLAAQAEQASGGRLLEIYGSTESGQVALRRTTQSELWETFGAIRVQAQAGPDGVERFVFDGDFLPEPTPMADVLELVDARRFRLLGRANDLIHVAGRRSSLGHLNYHLNSIPGVHDGAFWLPDDVADAVVRPVAVVVAPGLSAPDIVAALRERLEAVFVPRRVIHVAALPREGTGKLTVRALRELAQDLLASPAAASAPSAPLGPIELRHVVPHDHPCFAGHFPGQPLVPGALLLAELQEAMRAHPALQARLGATPLLAAAKFLAPVRPGSVLRIELQPEDGPAGGLRFDIHCESQRVATGRWLPGGPA